MNSADRNRIAVEHQRLASGQIWSTPIGMVGLGGVGNQVSLGQFELPSTVAQQATLTLGLTNLAPGFALGTGRIYAIIKYGVGTANQTVILDWAQGTSIALPCGKITVDAMEVDAKGAPIMPMPAGYVVNPAENIAVRVILTASLSVGDRSSLAAPTLTQTINLAAGVTVPWQVPARGKRVLVGDPRGLLATDVQAFIVGSLSMNTFVLANAGDSAIRTDGVILPGFTDNVQLLSPGGFNGIVLSWLLDG